MNGTVDTQLLNLRLGVYGGLGGAQGEMPTNTRNSMMPIRYKTFCHNLVAHGHVVNSSRQITEVKQHQARLVLGWVTGAQAMCRGVGQAFHTMQPLSTQQ